MGIVVIRYEGTFNINSWITPIFCREGLLERGGSLRILITNSHRLDITCGRQH